MKRIHKILAFVMMIAALSSCEKKVFEFEAEKISDESPQIKVFYMVPLPTGTTNNINKVEWNGVVIANEFRALSPFNFLPSGTTGGVVGKYYALGSTSGNLKLYRGVVTSLTLAYDQNVNLLPGKQSVFVHSFTQPPVIIADPMPLPRVTSEHTGTTAWIRFINMMYESPDVPTDLKLQYQWQYTTDNETGDKSDWFNLGQPVAFGEATGWEPVTVNKTVEISAGTARIDYRIRLIGADGSDQGSLEVRNTAGNLVNYSDWWNAQIGRVYNHVFAGYRDINNSTNPGVGIRQSVVH